MMHDIGLQRFAVVFLEHLGKIIGVAISDFAVAAVTNNIEDIILAGLAEIPYTSRLYEDVTFILDWKAKQQLKNISKD